MGAPCISCRHVAPSCLHIAKLACQVYNKIHCERHQLINCQCEGEQVGKWGGGLSGRVGVSWVGGMVCVWGGVGWGGVGVGGGGQ